MKFLKIKLKRKNNKINKANIAMSITMVIVCTVLVGTLLIQFKTVEEVNETDIENMRETELREQISNWKSKYEETNEKLHDVNEKIAEYNSKIEANEESSSVLDNELLQSNILIGNTKVTGEGVVITLEDTDQAVIEASDLLELVNQLRAAGAEAISINEIRITSMSDIFEISSQYILVKPKQRISSPYVVKAIGNQTYLVSSLSIKNTGYIDSHTNSGQSVKLEKQRNITIQKYLGNFEVKYMKEAEK